MTIRFNPNPSKPNFVFETTTGSTTGRTYTLENGVKRHSYVFSMTPEVRRRYNLKEDNSRK